MSKAPTVTLGGFAFGAFEVPERIPFGGEQLSAMHQMIGGARVVDAMGRSDRPIEWSGRFQGKNALQRARYVDALRMAGKALTLTWSAFNLTVLLKRFEADYRADWEVPYALSCDVVFDNAQPIAQGAPLSLDSMMSDDVNDANALASTINDVSLLGTVSQLTSAVQQVQSFVTATSAQVGAILTPLAAGQTRIGVLISASQTALGEPATLGGLLPGAPAAQNIAALTAQVSNMGALPPLYDLQNVFTRMQTNLAALGVAGNAVTQAGGDLYRLAAQNYGDASEWATIAKANGLTDPVLTGVNTILVPPSSAQTGGVLSDVVSVVRAAKFTLDGSVMDGRDVLG